MIFEGFSPDYSKFLSELQANNNKPWFEPRRQDYENLILTPLRKLVMDLSHTMLDIDPEIEVRPLINKTISRIFRDTRFSKDKRMFRDHLWITFRRPVDKWHDMPSWWFEIMPRGYTYGMGFYHASPETMRIFRNRVETNLPAFRQTISFYPGNPPFELEGAMYKRPFSNDLPEDIQTWYHRKNMYLICKRPTEGILYTPQLTDLIRDRFWEMEPLYRYWMECSHHS